MKAALIVFLVIILSMVAGLVIPVSEKHDLGDAVAVEITAIRKTGILEVGRDRVTQKIEVTDSEEITELNRLLHAPVRRTLAQLSALEDWTELYTLRFTRDGKEEHITFSEREWSPGGRTPPAVLEWVRKKANQISEVNQREGKRAI